MLQTEKRILLAMCIGDGYVRNNVTSGTLIITHCDAQKDYCEHKANLISKILHKPIEVRKIENGVDKFGNILYGYKFYVTHKYFKCVYNWLYNNKKKTITRKILNKLTPESIAIWYMDDGNLATRKNKEQTYVKTQDIYLNTGLQKEENQVIIDYFYEVWGIKFHQVKNNSVYRLRAGIKEGGKFIKLISPYIHESMLYKINVIDRFKKYILYSPRKGSIQKWMKI